MRRERREQPAADIQASHQDCSHAAMKSAERALAAGRLELTANPVIAR